MNFLLIGLIAIGSSAVIMLVGTAIIIVLGFSLSTPSFVVGLASGVVMGIIYVDLTENVKS